MKAIGQRRSSIGLGLSERLRRMLLGIRRERKVSETAISANASVPTPRSNGEYLRPGMRIFHDGDQHPPETNIGPADALQIRTNGFDGSYVSLVAELVAEQARKISVGADLIARIEMRSEPPRPAYLRAHFSNEDGREVLHDLIVIADGSRDVRFNLDGLRIPLDLATTAWVDLVFSDPDGFGGTLMRFDLTVEDQ